MRGEEPWKESKLGVIYREDNHVRSSATQRGCVTEARYVGYLGDVDTFKEFFIIIIQVLYFLSYAAAEFEASHDE